MPGDGCQITVAPKGAGSENMSRLTMLKPADGVQGVKDFVLDTVKQAGANPCPPIVLGIGIGGSFDHCATLAKQALLRPLDVPNPDPYYAALEKKNCWMPSTLPVLAPRALAVPPPAWGVAIEQKSPPAVASAAGGSRSTSAATSPPSQKAQIILDAAVSERRQAGNSLSEAKAQRRLLPRSTMPCGYRNPDIISIWQRQMPCRKAAGAVLAVNSGIVCGAAQDTNSKGITRQTKTAN